MYMKNFLSVDMTRVVCLFKGEKQIISIPSKRSSAQVGVLVNSVLTRNGCIKCYILLVKEIIL